MLHHMKILLQLSIIFGIVLAGDALATVLPFPFPGSICAMLILLILLLTGVFKHEFFNETGTWLQKNMAFFFLPANISVLEQLDIISRYWLQILLISVITMILTFAASAGAAALALHLQEKWVTKKQNADGNLYE
jgi:holin-like protein